MQVTRARRSSRCACAQRSLRVGPRLAAAIGCCVALLLGCVEQSAEVLLARHGEFAYDPSVALPEGSRPDPMLSARGRAQAESLAELASRMKVDVIVTSPLRRARETAEIIARVAQVQVEVDVRLSEYDPGDLLGRNWGVSPYREQFDSLLAHPAMRRRGGESIAELCGRAIASLDAAAARHPGRRILVVAHGLTNRSILGHLRGEEQTRALRRAAQPSTLVYRLWWPSGVGRIDSLFAVGGARVIVEPYYSVQDEPPRGG